MVQPKFLPLLPELICVFIYVFTAVQSARADDYIVDDPIGGNNQLSLEYQQVFDGPTFTQSDQPPVNPLSLACLPQATLFAKAVHNANANASEDSFLPSELINTEQL